MDISGESEMSELSEQEDCFEGESDESDEGEILGDEESIINDQSSGESIEERSVNMSLLC